MAAYGVNTDSWTETGITFANAPAPLASSLSSISVTNQAKYYELDVTSYVQAQLAGDKTVSLFIKDPNNQNKNLAFNSRENAVNPPQLVLVSGATASTVRINSGGPTATVSLGTFAADNYFAGSTVNYTNAVAIANTTDDVIYQTYRRPTATTSGVMSYNIPVTNGTYTVKLHFAEIAQTAAGARTFNVTAEGGSWLSNYDIFVAAGGANRAVVETKNVTVNDGTLNLNFTSLVNRACVAAIEVLPANATFATARITLDDANRSTQEAKDQATLAAFPNPNSGEKVSLELNGFGKNEKVSIGLYSLQGQLLQTTTVLTNETGAHKTTSTFQDKLSRGVYLVQAHTNSRKAVTKMVVW
jgi:hypothetical protein